MKHRSLSGIGRVLGVAGLGIVIGAPLTVLLGCAPVAGAARAPAASRELAQNGSFEQGGSPAKGWSQTQETKGKGKISRDQSTARSGRASLRLQPNRSNGGDQPLSISQLIPGGAYRGEQLSFSAYMKAEGGSSAVLGMLSIVGGRPGNLVVLTQGSGSDWVRHEGLYEVPDDASVQLVVFASVSGQSGSAWLDDLSVGSGPVAQSEPESTDGELTARIDVDASRVLRRIPATLYGTHVEWVYNAYGLWQESGHRPNPEMLRLTRELGVTLIRYPGGFLADFYHWRDGVGPVEKRPQALHQAGSDDRSRPNFGTDEALSFAERVGAELLITVNAGTGTAQEAADWVRYVNKDRLRVRYWEVGNELYIKDGSPVSKATTVDPTTYATRFLEFAKAMRAADSRIKIGAIGGENRGRYALVNYKNWNRTILERAGDQIDFLAVHNAYAPVLPNDRPKLRDVYRAMLAAPKLIARNLDKLADQISRHAPKRASQIEIAVTEWGPLFQADTNGRYIDHNKTLGAALFAASTLKALIESERTTIANFHELNDLSMLGWVGSRNGDFPPNPDWAPTARYFAFQLFTHHFGESLVRTQADGPTYDTKAVGSVDAVRDVPYLDVLSSLSADGRKLYVMAINRHFDKPIDAALRIRGFAPTSSGRAWTLNGTGIDAHTGTMHLNLPGVRWAKQAEDDQNPRFSKGGPGEITVSSSDVRGTGDRFDYRFPAHSVTAIELDRR